MSCDPSFSPDFFNNVAAIAVVLMFAKVVSHRTRKPGQRPDEEHVYALLHTVAVGAALMAVYAGLRATESCVDEPLWHHLAWLGLGVSGAALVIDLAAGDLSETLTAAARVARSAFRCQGSPVGDDPSPTPGQ